jgi:hypothetical protein
MAVGAGCQAAAKGALCQLVTGQGLGRQLQRVYLLGMLGMVGSQVQEQMVVAVTGELWRWLEHQGWVPRQP